MPRTLLLADDSITIQKVVGITFAGEDVVITSVDNGEDAIAKAREIRPDIILADVVMPRRNGYEVCETLKADPELKRIPVLLLAGTFEAFDEARARAARADGHIAKPFDSQSLVNKVNELLGAGSDADHGGESARSGIAAGAASSSTATSIPPAPTTAPTRPASPNVASVAAPASAPSAPPGGHQSAGALPRIAPPIIKRPAPRPGAPSISGATSQFTSPNAAPRAGAHQSGVPDLTGRTDSSATATKSAARVPAADHSPESWSALDAGGDLDWLGLGGGAPKSGADRTAPPAESAQAAPASPVTPARVGAVPPAVPPAPATVPVTTSSQATAAALAQSSSLTAQGRVPAANVRTFVPTSVGIELLPFGEPIDLTELQADENEVLSDPEGSAAAAHHVSADLPVHAVDLGPAVHPSRFGSSGTEADGTEADQAYGRSSGTVLDRDAPGFPGVSAVPAGDAAATGGAQAEASPADVADGGEAQLRRALAQASREVIERIAWEIIPKLAETIIREHVERLAEERSK